MRTAQSHQWSDNRCLKCGMTRRSMERIRSFGFGKRVVRTLGYFDADDREVGYGYKNVPPCTAGLGSPRRQTARTRRPLDIHW